METEASLHIRKVQARIQRGGQVVRTLPPPLKSHKAKGFLSNTGPDPLQNHKVTKPAFSDPL